MGAWDVDPYENDSALDFIGPIADKIKMGLKSDDEDKIIAAAETIRINWECVAFRTPMGDSDDEIEDVAIGSLEAISEGFFECWNDPDEKHYVVNRLIRFFKEEKKRNVSN